MPRDIKLHIVGNLSEGDSDRQIEAMGKVFELCSAEEADIIYCATISKMNDTINLLVDYQKPLAIYCWDYYKWAHEGKHPSYNWKKYAELLRKADTIFVPSSSQQLRLKELLNLDSVVVKTGITTFEAKTSDKNFILDPVRYYPEENRDWAEKAAHKLGIPIVHTEHQIGEKEFKTLMSTCSFMTCAYREASTGGLSLMEGLYLGKPSLVSNSPYMGARDYLGEFGYYFQYDDFDDFCMKMFEMWVERPKKRAKLYIKDEFSYDRMAVDLCEKLKRFKKG